MKLGLSSFLYALVGDLTQVCVEEMLNAYQKMLYFPCCVFVVLYGHRTFLCLVFFFHLPQTGLLLDSVQLCFVVFFHHTVFQCSPRFPKILR